MILELKLKNRWLATFLVYFFVMAAIIALISVALPIIWDSFNTFSKNFNFNFNLSTWPEIFQNLEETNFPLSDLFSASSVDFLNLFKRSVAVVTKISGGAMYLFFVFLLAFFLNTEQQGVARGIRLLAPKEYENYAIYLWEKTRRKVGSWFGSQCLISLFVSLMVLVASLLLGLPGAGFLALAAGLLDFLPYLGPFLSGILITLFGLTQSFSLGIVALLIFLGIQALENVIAPFLRSRAMKLNPLIIILALLFGGKVGGAAGIIVSLPLGAALIDFLKDLRSGQVNGYLPQKKLL